MKKLTRILMFTFTTISLLACEPKQGTLDQKESVKGDTLDVNEGKGEGDLGEGVIGG